MYIFSILELLNFGGCWESKIHALKAVVQVTIAAQTVTKEVLCTVLIEIKGIFYSEDLRYT